jgi:hypothetical protein
MKICTVWMLILFDLIFSYNFFFVPNFIAQISLLEECGFLDRALEELRLKETKIVCML